MIFVLAEGISYEEDGSNPQPVGKIIWMEGFPPDESGKLNLGPGNPPGFVWGLVEVTGPFQKRWEIPAKMVPIPNSCKSNQQKRLANRHHAVRQVCITLLSK